MRTKHHTMATRAAAVLALLWAASGPALAASSAASASSEGASTSVGSVSTSFEKSSASSTKGKDVAAGEYRVIDVTAAADRPGHLRVQLQALLPDATSTVADGVAHVMLVLPQAAAEQGQLAAGQRVAVVQRPYGLEFSQAGTGAQRSFFLVLHDDWARELQTKAVTL